MLMEERWAFVFHPDQVGQKYGALNGKVLGDAQWVSFLETLPQMLKKNFHLQLNPRSFLKKLDLPKDY
jgi:hypothetical protein